MRVLKINDGSISVLNLDPGRIAVIVEWSNNPNIVNKVVIRYKTALVLLGETDTESYSNLFEEKIPNGWELSHRVRVLDTGTTLEV